MSPDLLEAARALRDEVRELRSAVREVVAILENWNADRHRNHAGGRVRAPPGGMSRGKPTGD